MLRDGGFGSAGCAAHCRFGAYVESWPHFLLRGQSRGSESVVRPRIPRRPFSRQPLSGIRRRFSMSALKREPPGGRPAPAHRLNAAGDRRSRKAAPRAGNRRSRKAAPRRATGGAGPPPPTAPAAGGAGEHEPDISPPPGQHCHPRPAGRAPDPAKPPQQPPTAGD